MSRKDREAYNAYMREYQKVRYVKRRTMFIAELGGKCILCGSTENLEFDHIDPTQKAFNIGKWIANRKEEDIRAELKKCQLLCASCHKRKTVKAKSVEHGEGKTGVRNCRCEKCAPLKNAYARELKRRRAEEKKRRKEEGGE